MLTVRLLNIDLPTHVCSLTTKAPLSKTSSGCRIIAHTSLCTALTYYRLIAHTSLFTALSYYRLTSIWELSTLHVLLFSWSNRFEAAGDHVLLWVPVSDCQLLCIHDILPSMPSTDTRDVTNVEREKQHMAAGGYTAGGGG